LLFGHDNVPESEKCEKVFAPGIVADSPQGRKLMGSRSGRATGGSS